MALLRWNLDAYNGPHPISNGTGSDTPNALVFGAGTAALPVLNPALTANKNFISYYAKDMAASGTSRLAYLREYLSGGAGGEALRTFTTVENNTPADTVNGAHLSLNFGASVGNVAGEGQAVRATLHVPARTLGGTVAGVKGELFADGTTSNVSNGAMFRGVLAGNATGVGVLDDYAAFLALDGVTIAGGNMVVASGDVAASHTIRIKINGVAARLLVAMP
jgi:hypothetical protein